MENNKSRFILEETNDDFQFGKYKSNIDIILTFGNIAEYTFKELHDKFIYKEHFKDIEILKKKFKKITLENDLVYIKASRSMQLERIYN